MSPRFFEGDSDEAKLSKAGELGQEVVPDLVGYVSGKNRERLEVPSSFSLSPL